MKNLKRLLLFSKLMNNRKNMAAKIFADALEKLKAEKNKLSNLQEYQLEYYHKMKQLASSDQTTRKEIVLYQNFLENLQHVMEQHHKNIKALTTEAEKKRKQWVSIHTQHDALNKYIDKLKAKAQQEADRKAQILLDMQVNDRVTFSRSTSDD